MELLKKNICALLIVTPALFSSCNITPDMKRLDMFKEKILLPEDLNKKDYKNTEEKLYYRWRREIYVGICLFGRYNPKGIDRDYVDPEEAEKLLITYGWK